MGSTPRKDPFEDVEPAFSQRHPSGLRASGAVKQAVNRVLKAGQGAFPVLVVSSKFGDREGTLSLSKRGGVRVDLSEPLNDVTRLIDEPFLEEEPITCGLHDRGDAWLLLCLPKKRRLVVQLRSAEEALVAAQCLEALQGLKPDETDAQIEAPPSLKMPTREVASEWSDDSTLSTLSSATNTAPHAKVPKPLPHRPETESSRPASDARRRLPNVPALDTKVSASASDGVPDKSAPVKSARDEFEFSDAEGVQKVYYEGPAAACCSWDKYRIGNHTIDMTAWESCCDKKTTSFQTDNILSVSLWQNCCQRRRGKGTLVIHALDPLNPEVMLRVPKAIGVFEDLSEYIGHKAEKRYFLAKRRKGEVTHEEKEEFLYQGEYHSCCWGRGCCIGCCNCCVGSTFYGVTSRHLRVRYKSCCFSSHRNIYFATVYDAQMTHSCVSCCTWCQSHDVTMYTFDPLAKEVTISMRGTEANAKVVYDKIFRCVDMTLSADQAWILSKTEATVVQAHNSPTVASKTARK